MYANEQLCANTECIRGSYEKCSQAPVRCHHYIFLQSGMESPSWTAVPKTATFKMKQQIRANHENEYAFAAIFTDIQLSDRRIVAISFICVLWPYH